MKLACLSKIALIAATLCCCVCFANDSANLEAASLFARSYSLQNIREKGSQPFRLHLRIHAEHVVAKPVDGAYAEVWMSPEKWRREIAFPGFKQTEIGDVDSEWLTRNLDFRPRVIYLTAIAVEAFLHPKSEDVVSSLRNRKVKGVNVRCAELRREHGPSGELCFDSTGALVMESRGEQHFEYSDFDKFNGKIFPRSIRVYEGDTRLLEIRGDSLSVPPDMRPEIFQHEAGAHQMAACERWPADPVKKVPPQYPRDARNLGQQGTVTLYALPSGDGTVSKTSVLVSASSSLDQSASGAVKQWVYPQAGCGAAPLETEIEVQVNYRLSMQQ